VSSAGTGQLYSSFRREGKSRRFSARFSPRGPGSSSRAARWGRPAP
jgi:hypothetical protein